MRIGLTKSNIDILARNIHCIHSQIHWLACLRSRKTSAGMTKDDKLLAQWCRKLVTWIGWSFPSSDQCMYSAKQGKADKTGICASTPIYFQFAHFNVHNAKTYSKRVHSVLSRMLRGLRQETHCRRKNISRKKTSRICRFIKKLSACLVQTFRSKSVTRIEHDTPWDLWNASTKMLNFHLTSIS